MGRYGASEMRSGLYWAWKARQPVSLRWTDAGGDHRTVVAVTRADATPDGCIHALDLATGRPIQAPYAAVAAVRVVGARTEGGS